MTGATISYHLKILKKADLVWETKVKNFVYYELNTTVVEELLLWLSDLKGGRMMKGEERKEFLKEYKNVSDLREYPYDLTVTGRDPAVRPSAGEDRNTF